MMKRERTTRNEILNLLKKEGKMTAAQVGDTLGLTAMGARQHLMALERDEMVASEFVRQKAGRPALYFKLADKAAGCFPQEYSNLVLSLLKNLEELEGRDKVEQLLTYRREKLKQEYGDLINGLDLKKKVELLANLRDEGGYMAEMDEEKNELILKEHNCPIHNVAKEYPEVCQIELDLFMELLGGDVERIEHLMNGHNACVYKITNGKSNQNNEKKK